MVSRLSLNDHYRAVPDVLTTLELEPARASRPLEGTHAPFSRLLQGGPVAGRSL